MKIFGMEIPPKNEGAPLEKWYLKAKGEFEATLQSGDPISQMFALKKFDDISRKAEKKSSEHRSDFLKTLKELQTTKPELYTGYNYMQQEIMQSLSPVDYNKYLKTGELERHGRPMLGADGQPLFSDEKVVEMVALLSGADKEARSKIVKMIYEDKKFQDLDSWAKAAAVAGFFALQGLAPTEARAGVLEDNVKMERGVDATYDSNNQNEFRLVFNAENITKVEGDSLTLLGKRREVLARKSPTELGLDANTPLKMKTGTKYKLVNARERFDDKDGKIKVWDGFPGKKIFCLVEIDLNTEGKFMLAEDADDNLYAATLDGEELCWNRILPPEEENDDNGQFARPPAPPANVERENNLIAKRGLENQWFLENPVTRTEQLIGRRVEIETFNLDKHGGNSKVRMDVLYLVKQVDGNGDTYWKIVDGAPDFETYYPKEDIIKGRFTDGYNGLNGTSYTVPVPEDLKGSAREIQLASNLLGLDVRK